MTTLRRVGLDERRHRLARRHHVAADARTADVVRVAGDLVGLHATDPASIYLAARARCPGLVPADLERALYEDRTVLKHLAMRRTVWVVPVDLVPMVQAAATDTVAANERRKLVTLLEEHGIAKDGDRWLDEVGAETLAALAAAGEAFANDLGKAVPALQHQVTFAPGKKYEATVAVGSRVLLVLAAEGKIVRGRPRGSWISTQHRWALAPERLDRSALPSAAEARAALAARWLRAFGPATELDLKWWTGWTMGHTRAALTAIGAVGVEMDDGAGGVVAAYVVADDLEPEPPVDPWVALLPALDPTAMGWNGRAWYLRPHKAACFDRNGNVGPTIWSDGRIVGGWAQRKVGSIGWRLLEDVGAEAAQAIEAEVAAVQAWLGDIRFTPRFRTPLEVELHAP